MDAAKRYYKRKKFTCRDVSKNKPYDLVCTMGTREIHVEVKGSTTNGASILLTKNEVKHAQDVKNSCALFILHSIKLKGNVASGGTREVLEPWQLQASLLTPLCYSMKVAERRKTTPSRRKRAAR
jgi:hypothetical protein